MMRKSLIALAIAEAVAAPLISATGGFGVQQEVKPPKPNRRSGAAAAKRASKKRRNKRR